MTIQAGKGVVSAVFGFALLALGSCATPPPPAFPEITFKHLPPIVLDVQQIEVIDAMVPQPGKTHVEDRMPVAPKTVLRNWARDRLRAGGGAGVARFVIEDASVIETDLKINQDLKAKFTKEQAERYTANVRVSLSLEGLPGLKQAYATAAAERTQTVREDASINDRETILFSLTENLMRDFDPAMSQSIRQNLRNYVQ